MESLPIAIKLSDLSSLPQSNKPMLQSIINQIFIDLSNGNSCSKLSQIARVLETPSQQLFDLLINSDLCDLTHYNNININQLKPFYIIKTGSDYLLYLTRYLGYELDVVKKIKQLTTQIKFNIDNYDCVIKTLQQISNKFNLPNQDQYNAILNSLSSQLSIITGGPGTGKTTTVTLLLWSFYQIYGEYLKIKICAPTGKASSRVRESILNNIKYLSNNGLDISCFNNLLKDSSIFGTIHKLLGFIKYNIYFKHNANNYLDVDILVIDESSMIGLPLFSKLLGACDENSIKHIIFLGDKNQLSSVEEGYVFGALIDGIDYDKSQDLFSLNHISNLKISNRNSDEIGAFANAVLTHNYTGCVTILNYAKTINLYKLSISNICDKIFSDNGYLNDYISAIRGGENLSDIFEIFLRQGNLCLTNVGLYGTNHINMLIEKYVKIEINCIEEWYTGRPIIILENDYNLGLSNGDVGICLITKDSGVTKISVIFDTGIKLPPELLPKYNLAYAITIHKSQGSEYKHVNIMLADNITTNSNDVNNLLCKELIYTAITRAKLSLNIFGDLQILKIALENDFNRNTGIVEFLRN